MDHIRTISGKLIPIFGELEYIVPLLDIEDIAHSLSAQCRFNGHINGHLSVAQHCCWVADMVKLVAPEYEFEALMHDAAEAYISDVVRPIKDRLVGEKFVQTEQRIELAIAEKYHLKYPWHPIIKGFDVRATELEYDEVKKGIRLCWNASEAKSIFLSRFYLLHNERTQLQSVKEQSDKVPDILNSLVYTADYERFRQ